MKENLTNEEYLNAKESTLTSFYTTREVMDVRVLSSKLLKSKEQVKSQGNNKKSILGQIESFKTDDKTKSSKKEHSKGTER